jgi:V8-like Glu-specific endopeptidase
VKALLENHQNPSIYELLHKATVQITTPRRKGTGFFIGHDIIMTCAQVLMDTNIELIEICQDQQKYILKSYDINVDIDIAILRVKLDENQEVSFPCLDVDYQIEDDFYIYGYSSIALNGSSFAAKCQTESNTEEFIRFIGKDIDEGFSGSPLLNERTQKVCGVLRSFLSSTRLYYM